ncbi:hypothetical protein [Sphaerimonospora thailandensis]|uniref:hypothetical protein n=1 Tax=Sphaerimonospora thailandensis TaxID=795644 RepID=UPI0027E4329A|nr:hypothetical protein [Sphaerimonospora thailandensis]
MLAFPRTGITNAGSEGANRVIKTVRRDAYGFTVRRDAYGFRNLEAQRLRTRCAHHSQEPWASQPRLASKRHYPFPTLGTSKSFAIYFSYFIWNLMVETIVVAGLSVREFRQVFEMTGSWGGGR